MDFIKKNLRKLVLLTSLLIIPVFSLYADTNIRICPEGKICNPISSSTVQGFIQTLLEGVLRIGIPIVALAIIYCGFLFVTAIGNSEKIKKAKESLIYTLIGAAILLGSWAIATLISETVRGIS